MATHHIISGGEHRDLRGDHFDRLAPDRMEPNLTVRLDRLGFEVILA